MYQFAVVQQTSSVTALAEFFQKFWIIVRALSVNQTKVTWRNAFTDNRFALEREKESKNEERTHYWDYLLIIYLAVNV